MYVVDELEELVLKGLPQKLRGHLWMILSGAENDVSLLIHSSVGVNFHAILNSIDIFFSFFKGRLI